MAGAGFKTFNSGDILGASDVNTYLMQQSVMVFATTTARAAAITSPTAGMLTFITNNKSIELYDGSGWTSIGGGDNTNYPNQAVVRDSSSSVTVQRPLPYAMSAGSGSITTSGTITIGSTGRFTQAPIISLSVASNATNRTSATWASTGTPYTTLNVYVWTGAVAATVAANVYFTAVQMTSASASNT